MNKAKLIVSDSNGDSVMFYATGVLVLDDFIYIENNNKKIIYINDLEFNRISKEAKVDEVINYSRRYSVAGGSFDKLLLEILKTSDINAVVVPDNFKMKYAKVLLENGIKVDVDPCLFFGNRDVKDVKEIKKIKDVQRVNESAVAKAIDIIKKSTIGKDKKLRYRNTVLTSEFIKEVIHTEFLRLGCNAEFSIVSCGAASADPHNLGYGPLLAHQPIIIDTFPRSQKTRYFSDMTRTIVKGKASDYIGRMYEAVCGAQKIAIQKIKPGEKGSEIHNAVCDYFESRGFKTSEKNGKIEGFFHGTGHGVGYDVHELPIISASHKYVLKPGNVLTVEPGLYYPGIGGVRVEDLIIVEENGCKNLTKFPKVLEIR